MTYGGATYGGVPFSCEDSGADTNFWYLNLIFPVSLVFFGEIGEIVFLPPGIVLTPANVAERRSPCLVFDV